MHQVPADLFLYSIRENEGIQGSGHMKEKVLFICNHNAARSQMAEGHLRSRYGDRYLVCSAGVMKSDVSRNAVAVMREIGVDISGQRSKTLDCFFDIEPDYVVTLCDEAREACPLIPNAKKVIHAGF